MRDTLHGSKKLSPVGFDPLEASGEYIYHHV
jgi:hypothetical protein